LKYWLRRQDGKVRDLIGRHIELTLDDLRAELRRETRVNAAPPKAKRRKSGQAAGA
jgi:hypothetical protein